MLCEPQFFSPTNTSSPWPHTFINKHCGSVSRTPGSAQWGTRVGLGSDSQKTKPELGGPWREIYLWTVGSEAKGQIQAQGRGPGQRCHSASGISWDSDGLACPPLAGPGRQSHSEVKPLHFGVRRPKYKFWVLTCWLCELELT